MLNLTSEAAKQVGQRASAPPASGFRFPGFAAHYQDYEPSLDHFAFMRTVGAFWSKRHAVVLGGFLVFGLWSCLCSRRTTRTEGCATCGEAATPGLSAIH